MTAPAPLFAVGDPNDPNLKLLSSLSAQLQRANLEYDRFDRYYTGDQPLAFLAPTVQAQVGDRLTPMVINWPETIVDSVNRRLLPTGFKLGADAQADEELWRIFTANNLDEEAPLGQADALVHGLTFLSVWGNDDDPATPRIRFESAHQVAVRYAPGSVGQVVEAALKRWSDEERTYCTLYLPDRIVRYVARGNPATQAPRYEVDQELPNPLRAVPIVPMVNRGRLLNRDGRSELASVAPIADGINKLATDMMVTSEFFQDPRRYATGIQIPASADPTERDRLRAEAKAWWDDATKGKTWLAGQGVQFGQFSEADLSGFVSAINLLTASLAAIGGLPPDDLGLNTTNPASAEARRAAETTLVLRAKEKQRTWGGAYCRAMRLAIAARDGVPLADVPAEYAGMVMDWADPATQAIAQAMDAAVKGVEAGIYDVEAAQEVVGLGPAQRAAIKARRDESAAVTATADVRARVELAKELARDGAMTMNAALAAVGLLQAASTNLAEGNSATGNPASGASTT